MAKRKKQSPTQVEYAKQLRRIKQFINRAEKRGYIFSENVIPQRPKRVTKSSVDRLRKLTADTLYRKAQWVDPETGELRRGEVGRERERSAAGKRAAETRKFKKQAEQNFWYGGINVDVGIPATSNDNYEYLIPDEDTLNRIRTDNFLDEVLAKLGEPITTYINIEGHTRRRRAEVVNAAEQGRQRIIGIIMQRIDELGKPNFGKVINKSAGRINQLIEIVMYGSDGAQISSAITELVNIVSASGNLLPDELRDIGAYEEWNESWDEY